MEFTTAWNKQKAAVDLQPLRKQKMEHTGFEPVTLTMRMLRAPNCANAP